MTIKQLITLSVMLVVVVALGYWIHQRSEQTVSLNTDRTKLTTVQYACDAGKMMTATFYKGVAHPTPPGQPPVPTGSVDLKLSDGRTMTLTQTLSADGARYSNGDPQKQGSESFVFWSKGRGALVLENNQQKSYRGCIELAPPEAYLTQYYQDGTAGYTVRYPVGWKADPNYTNAERGPSYPPIHGVMFHIPTSIATGTNLSAHDTGLSVETLASTTNCTAAAFLAPPVTVATTTIDGTTYSVASTTGVGAGNIYDTTLYALPGTNPCLGIRYFIHSANIHNYPPGRVTAFDRTKLVAAFNAIRNSLIHR